MMNEWLKRNLVCPRDHGGLRLEDDVLLCGGGHTYRVVDGIPIMLLAEVPQTLWVSNASLKITRCTNNELGSPLFVESLGLSEAARSTLSKEEVNSGNVDPVVRYMVQATCGNLYRPLIGKLRKYPIPDPRFPESDGELFLDIGCNWGRWSIAAARKGYRVVGIDPSLGAVAAARRVSEQLGIDATYLVADARFLPFSRASFDFVFSYSVFQHFSRKNVRASVKEVARVLKTDGTSLIQMANMYGLRSFTHQAKRRFREAKDFEVRYWKPNAIREVFCELIGTTSLEVDGYFGLGIQKADLNLLPLKYQIVVYLSEIMRAASRRLHWLGNVADSVYVRSSHKGRNARDLQPQPPFRAWTS